MGHEKNVMYSKLVNNPFNIGILWSNLALSFLVFKEEMNLCECVHEYILQMKGSRESLFRQIIFLLLAYEAEH